MQHPLITVVDFSKVEHMRKEVKSCGFFAVLLRECEGGRFTYGLSEYDYQAGSLIFTAPDQVFGTHVIDGESAEQNLCSGYALLLHPDYISGTRLASRFKDFDFFRYEANEALRTTQGERTQVIELLKGIHQELAKPEDEHTHRIVLDYLEVLFDLCSRFYNRQFDLHDKRSYQLVERFNVVLRNYFDSGMTAELGLPTVRYCAEQLSLSSNYFGDLIRKATGRTAKEHIQIATVERIKHMLLNTRFTISEIGYQLGFKYPHHLSRVFRSVTGMTPYQFRTQGRRNPA
ncbi:MAG: helix-turn-helix transcriptional regulator [Muribaculaceae bacterium]|nr:helix-turn-helix transcriptional regulator [Muribaculaceae bacterium]